MGVVELELYVGISPTPCPGSLHCVGCLLAGASPEPLPAPSSGGLAWLGTATGCSALCSWLGLTSSEPCYKVGEGTTAVRYLFLWLPPSRQGHLGLALCTLTKGDLLRTTLPNFFLISNSHSLNFVPMGLMDYYPCSFPILYSILEMVFIKPSSSCDLSVPSAFCWHCDCWVPEMVPGN